MNPIHIVIGIAIGLIAGTTGAPFWLAITIAFIAGIVAYTLTEHLKELEGYTVLVYTVGNEQAGDPTRHLLGHPQ